MANIPYIFLAKYNFPSQKEIKLVQLTWFDQVHVHSIISVLKFNINPYNNKVVGKVTNSSEDEIKLALKIVFALDYLKKCI